MCVQRGLYRIDVACLAGMDGEAIFFTGRGGAGRGKAKNLWGVAGQGTSPLPTVWGGGGKGSKSAGLGGAGAGKILREPIEIICCSRKSQFALH